MKFTDLQQAMQKQFNRMVKEGSGELFITDIPNKNEFYQLYLDSFPEGTNPIYIENTEHDCNCCKSFIRQYGNMVAIIDGQVESIWNVDVGGFYQVVADVMAAEVIKHPIQTVFRNESKHCGTEQNFGEKEGIEGVITFDHFYLKLPNQFVMFNDRYGSFKGDRLADKQVLERSVKEISAGAVEIVLDLINQNSLYRGEEHKRTVQLLKKLLKEYEETNLEDDVFFWLKAAELKGVGRIKNTVIGTLLCDISDGVDLERAVKSFEDKVAPANYKRSKSLITQGMIDKAAKTIEELGLEDSLQRRYAVTSDLTINNVLFADNAVQNKMSGGVLSDLKPTKKSNKSPSLDKVEEVSVEDFISNILPNASSLEVMMENNHIKNLMSVVAPMNADAPNIMKWGNNFSWSYNGEVTDSMKEYVKTAGGKVDGVLRFSIKWNDEVACSSDLDAHCITPNGQCIYFGNKRTGGGELDVDIIEPRGVAVENITFAAHRHLQNGNYEFIVDNYSKRSGVSCFTAQIEMDGEIHDFTYDADLKNKVEVAKVTYNNGKFTIQKNNDKNLSSSSSQRDEWGVVTNEFTKVKMVMNSPNHWDGEQTGNKHYFFILDDCNNPDTARGFYNEFLRDDLIEHRKVFEVLSSKMKTPESDEQLSGLGFSSTQRNELLCRVKGSFNRVVKVKF